MKNKKGFIIFWTSNLIKWGLILLVIFLICYFLLILFSINPTYFLITISIGFIVILLVIQTTSKFIKRCFKIIFPSSWIKISKHKVPKWVRGQLYKKKFVIDRNRKYKVIVKKGKTTIYRYPITQGQWGETTKLSKVPVGSFEYRTKRWKKVKYYYKKIK